MKNKSRVILYKDELNDDFANNNIVTKKIDENYNYFIRNPFLRFLQKIARCLILPIASLIAFILYRPKIIDRSHALYKVKKKGYFIYSNHVLSLDPLIGPSLINPLKMCVIAASSDTFSINPLLSKLIKFLGGFPVPNTTKMYQNYLSFIKETIESKHRVLIYPEAHIWPYCSFIRNFTSTSFRYPVMLNAPSITLTTCFEKRKHSKKPKISIYVDGPFYPDLDLKNNESVLDLRNRVFETMKSRSERYSTYSYIEYIKMED